MKCASLGPRVFLRAIVATWLLLQVSTSQAVTVFNNGAIHSVSGISDNIEVRDGPAMATTTVRILVGADVESVNPASNNTASLDLFEHSLAQMSGGSLQGQVNVRDNARFEYSGGTVGDELFMFNNATALITGGTIGDDITTNDSSSVQIQSVMVRRRPGVFRHVS